LVNRDNGLAILTAAEVLAVDEATTDGDKPMTHEFAIGSAITEGTIAVTYTHSTEGAAVASTEMPGMAWLPAASADLSGLPTVQKSMFRSPTDPEECCICRSVKADGEASSVIQSIGREQLKVTESMWAVTTDLGDLSPWHGAPVVSMQDGKVIGIFVAGKSGAMIAPNRIAWPEK
jgi:hypothetical protein